MGKIERKEMLGYEIKDKIYCYACACNLDKAPLEKDVLLKDNIDKDDEYFCDECGKNL